MKTLPIRGVLLTLALCACAAACGNKDSAEAEPGGRPSPTSQKGAAGPGAGQFAATPNQPGTSQPTQPGVGGSTGQKGYPRDAIAAIPDNCASAVVVLSTAPPSVGDNYAWPISRQTFLANQQFQVVPSMPSVPGQVYLATHTLNGGYALVGRCKDGGTCNDVAAMYKAIVRSSMPNVVCGNVKGLSASPVGRGFEWASDPTKNLPASNDTVAKCARLNACMIATNRSTPGDPFAECQKGPAAFKVECAAKYPCSEVLACAGR